LLLPLEDDFEHTGDTQIVASFLQPSSPFEVSNELQVTG